MPIFLKTKKNTFASDSSTKEVLGPKLRSFVGCDNSSNKLNQPYGQLVRNLNMEYLFAGANVYLKTKRGSSLILDITNKPYGAALFSYDQAEEWLVWIDGSDIKTCETNGLSPTTISAGLSTSLQTFFVMYGQARNATLYGVNGTDALFKLTYSSGFSFASVPDAPKPKCVTFSTMSGRLFCATGHNVYFSEVQTGTGTANLEDFKWNGSSWSNSAIVSPDSGSGFNSIVDLGIDGLYFLKDTGIWVLSNVSDVSQRWSFPQCKADVGTLSPKTVQKVNYMGKAGVIYLATDKTLRFFMPSVQYNAGTINSVVDSDSKIISDTFQSLLDEIPDNYIHLCVGTYFESQYILNFPSLTNSTELDRTITIDLDKAIPGEGQKIVQPFWFESANMDYSEFVVKQSTHKLFGFNVNGYIAEVLKSNIDYEEMPDRVTVSQTSKTDADDATIPADVRRVAIEYEAFTAWHDFASELSGGNELELYRSYINWKPTSTITAYVAAATRGDIMPDFNRGSSKSLTPTDTFAARYNVAKFNIAYFGSTDVSQNIRVSKRGHWFNFGFGNTAYGSGAEIYGIDPIFKLNAGSPTGVT